MGSLRSSCCCAMRRRRATSIPTSSSCWGVRPSSSSPRPTAVRYATGIETRRRYCCAPWCSAASARRADASPSSSPTPRQCRSWCRRCVRPATSAIRSARGSWWIATSCAIGCWAGASSAWTTSTSRGSSLSAGVSSISIPLAPSCPTAWTSSTTSWRACASSRWTASSRWSASRN